ncbi:MAG: OB-fold protein [Deltaproteobacteria bacterium]
MKKFLKIALILAIAGLIGAFLVWKFYINKPKTDVLSEKADFELSAADLFNAYASSDSVLIEKYTDRIIQLTGKADTVEILDSLVNVLFVFGNDEFGKSGVRCSMLSGSENELKSVDRSKIIVIKGINKGYNGSDVIIESAVLINR